MKKESSECNIMEIKQKIEVFGNEMWVNTWRIDDLQKKILKLKVERIDKLEDRIKFLEEKDMKNTLSIHELQKITGTRLHKEEN